MARGRRHRLSLRTSLWLAVGVTVASTVLGASALYGYQLYRSARQQDRLRVRAVAETYAAQIEPLLLTAEPQAPTEFVQRLPWHHSVCLLAVLNTDGQPLALRGSRTLLDRFLAVIDLAGAPTEARTWEVPAKTDDPMPDLVLAAVPLRSRTSGERIGTLVCVTRLVSTAAVSSGEIWSFFGGLMLIALVGILLGSWYLRQCVVRPLVCLTRQATTPDGPAADAHLPAERTDEIGELAKAVTDLNVNAENWRQRTLELRDNLSRRVNTETAKIARELQAAKRKIWTDPLTRLGNRRLLDDKLADIYRAQQEAGQDLSIAMIDVDHFKTLNDTLGHQAGDELLQFIGELLRQCLRESDLAVRFGGDEFALILPGVSVTDARTIGERTVRLFGQRTRLLTIALKPTMSVGIASLNAHRPASAEELMKMADQALYAAKHAGKAQVAVYAPRQPAALRPGSVTGSVGESGGLRSEGAKGCSHGWSEPQANETRGSRAYA